MVMSFIRFKGRGARVYRDEPTISITGHGTFSIGRLAYESFFRDYSGVFLNFDPDRRVIGIEPTNEEAPEVHKIRVFASSKGIQISAQAFLDYCKIERGRETKKYPVRWNDTEKMVELELEK
jgi:hypothetical protein